MIRQREQWFVSVGRDRQVVNQDLAAFVILFLIFGLLVVVSSAQGFGQVISLVRQSTQEARVVRSGVGDEKDVRALEPGKPIKRELAGGQQDTYQIRLSADQFLKATVEQDGIDVVVQVLGPDGRQVLEFDYESRERGQESVSVVAEVTGDYQLTVQPRQKRAPAGGYEIRIQELRAATESDRSLHEARKLYDKYFELRRAGKYDDARPLVERALGIRERLLGPDHPDVAVALNGLATLYWYKGDYTQAEPLYQRALLIREKVMGPEHPDVANSLHSLAATYFEIGDYAKAEPFSRRALAIREKALGPEHPSVALSLNSMAVLYHRMRDYAKAEPLYQRTLSLLEKALGPEHADLGFPLNNLANLYCERGDLAKAEPLYQRGLSIREKALGPEHHKVADSLTSFASFYRYKGEYTKAEMMFQRALAIRERTLGPKHPNLADSLNHLAVLYIAKGDIDRAIMYQSRVNAVAEHDLALNFGSSSERRKLAYLDTPLSKQAYQTLSLHVRYAPSNPAARDLAATLVLQRKGRALDAISENLNTLRSRFNPEDQALLDQLTETRSQIARLTLDGPQRLTPGQYQEQIKALEDQAEDLEAKISRKSSEFRAQSLPITLAAVQAAIPANAALIEFASYRPFDAKTIIHTETFGQPRYVAYVLSHQGEIQWVELGEAGAIDNAIAMLREAMRDPKRRDVKNLARIVDEKVFQPLRPLIGERTQLLISPEGALNLIPFAALVDERGRYLVERYSISYLASGRDLLRLQVGRKNQSGPLIVANPDFGGRYQVEAARLLKPQKSSPKGQAKEESSASVFSRFYFPALPYTAGEGEAIHALLPSATLLTHRQANKMALSQIRAPLLLHIATHGFFFEDLKLTPSGESGVQAASGDHNRWLQQVEKSGARIESPLLRSGLALAGANEQKNEDNGILTALEVSGLNLWGTKLVVLSACDTGVGEVRNGDGVYGLRRALVLAGSESQVMSLWPVSDRWTRDLMVAYYRGLQRGEGRGEALRQVQLEMLKNVRHRHPYYWASFIQSGEWANLEGKREQ